MQRFPPQGNDPVNSLYANAGDILVGASAGTPVKLAKGADRTILASGSTTLEWTDEIIIDGGSA